MAGILAATILLSQSMASAFVCPPASPLPIISPSTSATTFPSRANPFLSNSEQRYIGKSYSTLNNDGASAAESVNEISKAPSLNGKMVLPTKAMTAGLKGHKVAAVYAILNSNYKRGSGEGWEHVQHISFTRDLAHDISHFLNEKGPESVAHVRALSFSYPQKATMEDFANGWKGKVQEVGGVGGGVGWGAVPPAESAGSVEDADANDDNADAIVSSETVTVVSSDYEFDEDDEDMDDDDMDDYIQMMAESRSMMMGARGLPTPPSPPLFVDNTGTADVISPFQTTSSPATESVTADRAPLELTIEGVDKVLDEVRPYLISDGGNVSVPRVDAETGNVYLLLEGACGSCASSTVTMKMGIERVLKENFGDRLGQVIQVEPEEADGGGEKPTELTMEAVQAEVNRISGAIVAMGGVIRVVSVDPIGVVEIEFRGPNKVQKGLELALLDVEYVKHVKFVS